MVPRIHCSQVPLGQVDPEPTLDPVGLSQLCRFRGSVRRSPKSSTSWFALQTGEDMQRTPRTAKLHAVLPQCLSCLTLHQCPMSDSVLSDSLTPWDTLGSCCRNLHAAQATTATETWLGPAATRNCIVIHGSLEPSTIIALVCPCQPLLHPGAKNMKLQPLSTIAISLIAMINFDRSLRTSHRYGCTGLPTVEPQVAGWWCTELKGMRSGGESVKFGHLV